MRGFASEIVFRDKLPEPKELGEHAVLIYDRVLVAKIPGFRTWVNRFPVRFEVTAGEGLKQLSSFTSFIEKFIGAVADYPASTLRVVSVGGGSVGDFSGFVASVFKRGVDLIHIPSTWLSAIDSAHGGKTALNLGGFKNQLGTFYPASKVYLIKKLLFSQPEARTQEAFGELAKIALIDGRRWTRAMMRSREKGGELIWAFLPEAIESKQRVVRRDPRERKKIRQVLNLGHTLGHVIEAGHGVAHGEAVAQGMVFAIQWSERRGLLEARESHWILQWLSAQFGIHSRASEYPPLPETKFLKILKEDKKRDSNSQVLFVFLMGMGKTELISVSWTDFLTEARRQGWLARKKP